MLNPGYSKTVLKSNGGDTLLPMTTASMVSEEPDRRFVDNVEKSLLFLLADSFTQLKELADNYGNLVLLAENADDIMPRTEQKEALVAISENINALSVITQNIEVLLAMSKGDLVVNAKDSENQYKLLVDESDESNPVLTLSKIVEDDQQSGETEEKDQDTETE